MTTVIGDWVTVWVLDGPYFHPKQVRVLPVGEGYVLVEGETHTRWKGGFFNTIEAAFKAEQESIVRSRRHDDDRQKRLDKARERHSKGGA